MPPFLQFVLRRFLAIPVSLVVITLVLYGGVMLTPPEGRATLYYSSRMHPEMSEKQLYQMQEAIIERNHLREPFLVQYAYWIQSLFDGTWGYSPSMNEYILPALLRRTPVTLELGLYSLLFLIPLGLLSGVIAGWKRSGFFDRVFRSIAFVSTSTPAFILALVLLSVFYINLDWFAPDRLSLDYSLQLSKGSFRVFTGMLTVGVAWNMFGDGLNDLLESGARQSFDTHSFRGRRGGKIKSPTGLQEGDSPSARAVLTPK